uniref:Uncharacterized protein n=1 Tax=Ciona savignyi TaxID=51511 RepID=H2YHK5_CIOSA
MAKSSAKKSLELGKQSNSLANFNKLKTMMKDQFSKSSPIDPSPQGKRPIAPKKIAEKEKPAGDLLGQILNMQSEKKDATRQNKAKEKPSMPAEEDHIQPVEHLDKQELQARSDGQVCFYTLWSFADVRVLIRGTVHGEMMVKTDKVTQ